MQADGAAPPCAIQVSAKAAAKRRCSAVSTLDHQLRCARRSRAQKSFSKLQRRFAAAFAETWMAQGGAAPISLHFDRSPDALVLMKRELGKGRSMLHCLHRRQRRGFCQTLSGDHRDLRRQQHQRPPAARDIARPRGCALCRHSVARRTPMPRSSRGCRDPSLSSAALARLYALGLDAFRVAAAFKEGRRAHRARRRNRPRVACARTPVHSRGKLAVYRNGELVPAELRPDPARAPAARAPKRSRPSSCAPRPDDRRAQFPHALRRDRPDRAATATTLVFVEVRLRTRARFGGAAESITAAKRARLDRGGARLPRPDRAASPPAASTPSCCERLDAARIDWRRDVVDVE